VGGVGAPAGAGGSSGRVVAGARAGAAGVPADDGGVRGLPAARTGGATSPEDDDEPEGGLRGASAELRRKLRTQRRLRLVTLMSLAALVLLVLPAFFGVRAMSSDPVLASLDALDVPAWASKNDKDFETGNSLCLGVCEFRERVSESDQSFAETTKVYAKALTEAGWSERKVEGCPEMPVRAEEGTYTCWQRDELTLDLAVGLPGCAVDQVSAEGNPQAGAEAPEPIDPASCVGSTVSIKVWNAIEDERGKKDPAPGPQGVQPDAVLPTDDSIFQQSDPTPEAS
jgi:integrin beta 3